MEWIGFQDFSRNISSSGSSTQIISTDSLDNLLPQTIMAEKQLQRFDCTSRIDLFVPEFIPLPSIKSPRPIFKKQLENLSILMKPNEGEIGSMTASLRELHNSNPTLQEQRLTQHYQLSYKEENEQVDHRSKSASDGEQENLTTITSLGSSTPTKGLEEDEITIPM